MASKITLLTLSLSSPHLNATSQKRSLNPVCIFFKCHLVPSIYWSLSLTENNKNLQKNFVELCDNWCSVFWYATCITGLTALEISSASYWGHFIWYLGGALLSVILLGLTPNSPSWNWWHTCNPHILLNVKSIFACQGCAVFVSWMIFYDTFSVNCIIFQIWHCYRKICPFNFPVE